eukprot:scaffold35467_cov199-Amphora_coffeaeformis.AAC.1
MPELHPVASDCVVASGGKKPLFTWPCQTIHAFWAVPGAFHRAPWPRLWDSSPDSYHWQGEGVSSSSPRSSTNPWAARHS